MSLDPKSVLAANRAFFEKYPERNGKLIEKGEPGFDQLAKEWTEIYEDANTANSKHSPNSKIAKSTSPAGEICIVCGASQNKPSEVIPMQQEEPCDFKSFKIECQHGRSISYTRGLDGILLDDLPQLPPKATRTRNHLLFEVLAKPGKTETGEWGPAEISIFGQPIPEADKVKITLEPDPSFCAQFSHPHLIIFDGIQRIKSVKQKNEVSFDAHALMLPAPPATLLAYDTGFSPAFLKLLFYVWLDNQRVNRYEVHAIACPLRLDDDYSKGMTGNFSLPVDVYPADTYEISIALKPLYKRDKSPKTKLVGKWQGVDKGKTFESTSDSTHAGWKKESSTKETHKSSTTTAPSGYKMEKSEKSKTSFIDGNVTQKTGKASKDGYGKFKESESTIENKEAIEDGVVEFAQKKLEIKRNGVNLYKPKKDDSFLETILGWMLKIQNLCELIKQLGSVTPKVGYWVDISYEVLSGSVKVEWSFKERKDNTVYRYWKISLSLTLFKGSITVNYGMQLGFSMTKKKSGGGYEKAKETAQARIYFKIGGTVTASANKEADAEDSPDNDEGWEAGKISGKIPLSLGAQAELPGEFLSVKIEGSFALNAEGTVYVGGKDVFLLKLMMSHDPVEATFTFKAGTKFLAYTQKVKIIEGSKPFEFARWPSGSPVANKLPDPITNQEKVE